MKKISHSNEMNLVNECMFKLHSVLTKELLYFCLKLKEPILPKHRSTEVTGGQAEQTQEDTAARGKAKQPIISALALLALAHFYWTGLQLFSVTQRKGTVTTRSQ